MQQVKYLTMPLALLLQAGELGMGDHDLKLFLVSQGFANDGEFFPGTKLLGQAMGLHYRRVQCIVVRLENLGLVRKRYRETSSKPSACRDLGLDFGPIWHRLRDTETVRMPVRPEPKTSGRPRNALGYWRNTKTGSHWVKGSNDGKPP